MPRDHRGGVRRGLRLKSAGPLGGTDRPSASPGSREAGDRARIITVLAFAAAPVTFEVTLGERLRAQSWTKTAL